MKLRSRNITCTWYEKKHQKNKKTESTKWQNKIKSLNISNERIILSYSCLCTGISQWRIGWIKPVLIASRTAHLYENRTKYYDIDYKARTKTHWHKRHRCQNTYTIPITKNQYNMPAINQNGIYYICYIQQLFR